MGHQPVPALPDEDIEGFTTTIDNPADPAGEYSRASRVHAVRTFYVYDLPFLRNGHNWASRLAGGWQLSGSITVNSGNPLNIILGYDANSDGISSRPLDRPDLVGPHQIYRRVRGCPDGAVLR